VSARAGSNPDSKSLPFSRHRVEWRNQPDGYGWGRLAAATPPDNYCIRGRMWETAFFAASRNPHPS